MKRPLGIYQFLLANRLIINHYHTEMNRFRHSHPALYQQAARNLEQWKHEVGKQLEKALGYAVIKP